MAKETYTQKLERMLLNLFDAQYGMSYHHCGDGDGLSQEDAAEIVEFVRSKWEPKVSKRPNTNSSGHGATARSR